jgi:hypothetical protein
MMYLTLTAIVVLFIAFTLIVMNIIESRMRTKENERILWKMEQLDEVSADDLITDDTELDNKNK